MQTNLKTNIKQKQNKTNPNFFVKFFNFQILDFLINQKQTKQDTN